MPCGGIYPLVGDYATGPLGKEVVERDHPCWVCKRRNCKHFCDEWDTTLHARCALDFLNDEEGQMVISHEHQVVLDFSLDEEVPKEVTPC